MQAFPKSTEKRKNFVTIQKNTPKIKTSKCRRVFKAKEIFSRVDFGKKECRNHKDENKNFGGKIFHLWQDNLMKIPVFPRVYAHARVRIKKQAHATVANEDFKPFKNNLKASDRQERKSPFI